MPRCRARKKSDNPVDLADANIEMARLFSERSSERVKQYLDAADNCIAEALQARDLEQRQAEIKLLRG